MRKGIAVVVMLASSLAVAVPSARAKGASPAAVLAKLVERQAGAFVPGEGEEGIPDGVYAEGATFTTIGGGGVYPGIVHTSELADAIVGPGWPQAHKVKDVRVTAFADGVWAVVSFTATFRIKDPVMGDVMSLTMRASEAAVKTADGWRIQGGMWSAPASNAAVNAAAQAGKLADFEELEPSADEPALVQAVNGLVLGGIDPAAAARKDLVAIGSGPGEVTTTGKALAGPWQAVWMPNVELLEPIRVDHVYGASLARVTANLRLTKRKGDVAYTIPFRVLFVFEKDGDAWSLRHAHFAVPSP